MTLNKEVLHFLNDRISSYGDIDLKPLVILSLVFHEKKYQILKAHFQYEHRHVNYKKSSFLFFLKHLIHKHPHIVLNNLNLQK